MSCATLAVPRWVPHRRLALAYVLLVNEKAGSAEQEAVAAAQEVLATHGDCELAETGDPSEVGELLETLDDRQLVVCGGDGSVHVVVAELRSHQLLDSVTLGWVPLGTGNDLARTLGIPLDPADAARTIIEGGARELDLIVADNGDIAVNALHAGIGVDAAARAERLKGRMGEFAYPLGAIAAGVTAEGWNLIVEVDGEALRTDPESNVLLAAVMNGRSYGGGTEMAPTAEPDDGQLDVIVCTPLGPAQRAAFGVALQTGNHLDREDVVFRRGSEVSISGDPVGYNIDGELVEDEFTERRFRIEPDAWRILTP